MHTYQTYIFMHTYQGVSLKQKSSDMNRGLMGGLRENQSQMHLQNYFFVFFMAIKFKM